MPCKLLKRSVGYPWTMHVTWATQVNQLYDVVGKQVDVKGVEVVNLASVIHLVGLPHLVSVTHPCPHLVGVTHLCPHLLGATHLCMTTPWRKQVRQ